MPKPEKSQMCLMLLTTGVYVRLLNCWVIARHAQGGGSFGAENKGSRLSTGHGCLQYHFESTSGVRSLLNSA